MAALPDKPCSVCRHRKLQKKTKFVCALNLETAVGCARVCRERRGWQGLALRLHWHLRASGQREQAQSATVPRPARVKTQRARARKEEQRRQARRARRNWAQSAFTQTVKANEGKKVSVHKALEMFTSGQLRFLS